MNVDNKANLRLLDPDYKLNDHGIDPKSDIFAKPRVDQEFDNQSTLVSCIANSIFAFTSPLSWCCLFNKLEPMNDLIRIRCGIVEGVWRKPGVHIANPCFLEKKEVYMGLTEVELKGMAANDKNGSPIIVSAQFAYRVVDSISAYYKTSNLTAFLRGQAETALRSVVGLYPYDVEKDSHAQCLRRHSDEIDSNLQESLQKNVTMVGVKIEFFRLFGVGYDPKMEKLLLARQEAQAEVDARKTIAEGTTGIVHETVEKLAIDGINLSPYEKNRLATNLTMMLVNHGHTSLNIFDGVPPSQIGMGDGKEKQKSY